MSVRARLAEALEEGYDEKLRPFFDEALKAEKQVWGTCSKCQHRTPIEVPDWSARAKVVELLLTQGFGRPKNEDEAASVTLIVHRTWPFRTEELAALIAGRADPETVGEQTARDFAAICEALLDAGWTPPPLEEAA
jgi:hypothetical protein